MSDGYIGYAHGICLLDENRNEINKQNFYIGISKRNWLQRMSEHFNEVRSGSNKTFHRAWREYAGRNDAMFTSELVVVNHTYEQIMAWEEMLVDRYMESGTSLNMIPGGFKGLQFLHQHRLLSSVTHVTIDEREAAIRAYHMKHPRLGIPNMLISELWNDEEYAQRVICGVEGRLTPDQIRHIRLLNEKFIPIERITEMVGARNMRQVERVLKGKTYSRIH